MEQLPTEILHLIVQQCFLFEDLAETVYALSALACSCWSLNHTVQHCFPKLCDRIEIEGCPLRPSNLRLACLLYKPPDLVEPVPDRIVVAVDSFGDFVYSCCTIPKMGVDACFTYCEETDTVCWKTKTEEAYWVQVSEEERERQDPVLVSPHDAPHRDCYVKYFDFDDDALWTYTGGQGKKCIFHFRDELDDALVNIDISCFERWLGSRFPNCLICFNDDDDEDIHYEEEIKQIYCMKIEKVKEVDNPMRKRALRLCKKVRQCSSRLEQDEYQKLLDNIEQLLSATKSK